MKWTSWVTLAALIGIVTFVVLASLNVGGVRCEVCITFNGREACRSVDGDTEADAHMAAVTNACALIASGVTDTVACQRTAPTKTHCGPH
jgi:hypothetical protein